MLKRATVDYNHIITINTILYMVFIYFSLGKQPKINTNTLFVFLYPLVPGKPVLCWC